tara:strand:+ start:4553 stop:7156 length:2604 start_codon:yes stop_codon:yes gene_type:complete
MSTSKNDILFEEISIKPDANSDFINIMQGNFQASSMFGGMSINEGLFHGGLSGFVILNDPDPDQSSDELPSIGSLLLPGSMIRFTFNTQLGNDQIFGVNQLSFYVYNVSIVSNIAPGITKLGSSQSATYRVEFASYEGSALNYENFPLIEDRDYVGSIGDFFTDLTYKGGVMSPTLVEEDQDESEEQPLHITNTCQIDPEIVDTYNGVWFKRRQSHYPWGKEKSMSGINKLTTTALNYAIPLSMDVDSDDDTEMPAAGEENNPSYVFYQSLQNGQWHFVPIGGSRGLYGTRLIGSEQGVGWHEYAFTMDENVDTRVEKFKLIKSADILEMQDAGVFGSSYTLIEPNWKGIYNGIAEVSTDEDDTGDEAHDKNILGMRQTAYYHDFMSISSHLKMEDVVYKYSDFFPIEEEEEGGDDEVPIIGPLLGNYPLQNGNVNPIYSSLTDPVYGYFDERYLNRPTPTIIDDYASSRGEENLWQTMFDMTELPYESLDQDTGEIGIKYIVDEIREPTRKAKLAYSLISDLKEQWNRYRHSICCGSDPDEFFAMIVGYTGGNTGDQNTLPYGITGSTLENFYRYSFVEVEVWPKALIPRGVSASDFIEGASEDTDYYDYILGTSDINPSTGEHKEFIAGNSADSRDDGITFTFGLNETSESGQSYKITQEQEFVVVPIEGGKRGLFTAYNTNELTNNKAFTSAGVNAEGYNYPSGFQLMPVGGMTSGISNETTAIPPTFMGSVVRMTSQNEDQLVTLKTKKDVIGRTGGYTGPDGSTGTDVMKVIYLLNQIMGTKNLPTPFGGSTLDISYRETVTTQDTDGNDVQEDQYTDVERDDKSDRSDITENASPQRKEVTDNPTVYLFSVENDHDGRCSV